uniref:Complexin n=1 Tax=Macrostomum lignano TaxID=282301 RepID=A0A1I8F1U6_9PLAT
MGNSEQMSPEEAEKLAERQAEIAEALAEEKRKRDEKHRKMESEREEMRQGIRDKYNIQKKEEFNPMPDGEDVAGRLGRKRKTPEELAAERDLEDQEDFASFLPEGVRDTVKSVTAVPQKMISDAQEKWHYSKLF